MARTCPRGSAVILGVRHKMKNQVYAAVVGFLVVALILAVCFSGRREHNPKDLSFWVRSGAAKDWSSEAIDGEPQAQFHLGMALVRSNLVTMVDRVPGLSAVPLLGKRFFETTSYGIDGSIGPSRLAEAFQWIKKSADQGFAPAQEAEKLFVGMGGRPTKIASPGSPLPILISNTPTSTP